MIQPLGLCHHFGFSFIRFWCFSHSWKHYLWSPWEPNQHKPVRHIDRHFVDLRNKTCSWHHWQFVTDFLWDLSSRVLDIALRDQTWLECKRGCWCLWHPYNRQRSERWIMVWGVVGLKLWMKVNMRRHFSWWIEFQVGFLCRLMAQKLAPRRRRSSWVKRMWQSSSILQQFAFELSWFVPR